MNDTNPAIPPIALIISVVVVLLIADVATFFLYLANVGTDKLVPHTVRFILTCLLCYSLVRGWSPGRWITVVLLGLGLVLGVRGVINVMSELHLPIFMIALCAAYLYCVIILLTPFAGRHFRK